MTTSNTRHSVDFIWRGARAMAVSLVFVLTGLQIAQADLFISPLRIVFDDATNAAEVILVNQSVETKTYRISWVEKIALPDGTYEDFEPDPEFIGASSLVRFSPRQVTLGPREVQQIRLSLNREADLPSGEYRSHLTFTEVGEPERRGAGAPTVGHQIATASTRLQGALSLVTELFTISPSFTATTVGDFFAFLTIRFSNAYDPKYRQSVFRSQLMSDRGALVAGVFLDANNNGVYDVGEVPVPSARVQAIQSNRGANTNEDGFAFIVGLPKNVLTDVIVVEGSRLDPFWLPSYEGRSIVPRAGSIHYLDFPIVETSEIEGKVLVPFPVVSDTRNCMPANRSLWIARNTAQPFSKLDRWR